MMGMLVYTLGPVNKFKWFKFHLWDLDGVRNLGPQQGPGDGPALSGGRGVPAVHSREALSRRRERRGLNQTFYYCIQGAGEI